MKKNLRLLVVAAVGAVASLAFTSCAYDPYYASGSTSVGGSYSSGYGDGYGYGGSSFSTSVFVGTGDPRWGYDPNCYSYYDYSRRAYYDPYLNGYYPIGYRPPIVYGVPHPYGWSPGHGYCPPPRGYRNVTVVNYRNRESAYRSTNYGWARQVRQQPAGYGRVKDQRPNKQQQEQRPNTGNRPSSSNSSPNFRPTQSREQNTRPAKPQQSSRNNTIISTRPQQQVQNKTGKNYAKTQSNQGQRPQLGNPGNSARSQASRNQSQPRQTPPRAAQGGNGNKQQKSQSNEDDKRVRGYR